MKYGLHPDGDHSRRARVGLLGFGEENASQLSATLRDGGCTCTPLPSTGSAARDRCHVLLVSTSCAESPSLLPSLVAARKPWLLMGSLDAVRMHPALAFGADELILEPWSAEELLLRLDRALRHTRPVTAAVPERDKPWVLVADDDPDILALMKAALQNQGLECRFARDGGEALELICALSPDLLLLDLDMPLIPGLEVLRRVRSDPATAHIRVLLLSASREERDIRAGSTLGADGYLAKPVDHLLLVRRIKGLLAERAELSPGSDPNPAMAS